ncbi:hemagglutination activity protein [Rhodanobacter sp. Soil772]|uniref:heme exporter protein CcmD n=1 Tax=Rhodanobacter sp. Soil772 TaxID=1736406 RepID=UPI0006FE8AB8|nr:heme exporter protein CcmD [Rhodanobacter sp. Soil772]KRE86926.1 hemagglutination activity protein [Rhodanobacter sp. Soil772]
MSALQHFLAVSGDAAAFFKMGGYAAYVWPAYAVFFVVLIADTIAPRLRRRRVLIELRARLARQNARQERARTTSTSPSP